MSLEQRVTDNTANEDTEDKISQLSARIAELQGQLCESYEETKMLSTKLEKANAIYQQKVSFYETQLEEAKIQREEAQNAHESLMTAFNNLQSHDANASMHDLIHKQRSEQLDELKALELKHSHVRDRLSKQVDTLTEQNSKLELEMKVRINELESDNLRLKQLLEETTVQKSECDKALKQLESEKLALVEQIEEHFKEKVLKLENDLSHKAKTYQDTIEEIQEEKDRQLEQLKEFYDQEKQRLETRIFEEKKNTKVKLEQQQEEHEEQLRDEQEMHEEEIEMLQENIKNLQEQAKEVAQQVEQELAIALKKIEYLEEALKEAKASLAEYQKSSANTLDKQLERSANERGLLKSALEREYEKKLTEQIKRHESDKEDLKSTLESQAKEIENLHTATQNLKDEIIKQQLDFTREQAISNQKIEFKEEKIKELSDANDTMSREYQDRIKSMREEMLGELEEKVAKLETENLRLTERFEAKRKSAKELENDFNKFKAEKDREAIIMEQKIYNLDTSYKKLNEKYEKELNELKEEHTSKLSSLEVEIEQLEAENTDLRTRLMDSERDISEIESNYERDKALWEDKFDFLENQKQQAKRDLQDAHKKFEMTVEQLRRKDTSDRGKSESAQMLLISSIEKKYKDQIKDMTDSHTHIVNELSNKYKTLEKEHKELKERYEIETRGKISHYGNLEKRITELIESEQSLMDEVRELKIERDRKCLEHQSIVEREKEHYKQKIMEAEHKTKSSEAKRSNMIFEFEKEKARWALEKDNLISEIESLSESIKKAKRKRDVVLKDNERLKNDAKNRGRFVHSSTMGPSIVNGVLTARQVELAKCDSQKSSGSTYLKSPTFTTKYIGDFSTSKSKRSSQHMD